MNRLTPAQIEMLLGGYATGTLTREENDALMRAALENQALFDALMDEEALRETLSDAATRDELLRALRPAEVKARWWQNPWPWAAVATALVAVAVLVIVRQETPQQTAKLETAAPQTQIAQSKPEPIPSEIAVPNRLQSRDESPAAKPSSALTPAPAAPPAQFAQPMPAAPPPPPAAQERAAAPAPPAAAESARRDQPAVAMDLAKESKQKGADKLTEVADTAKKGEAVTVAASADMISLEAQADPLTVVVAFQQQDGTWRPLPPGNSAPAGRPLRLTVTSTQRGTLSTDPPVAAAQSVEPNRPATLLIAARAAGDLTFRLSLNPASLATSPGAANLLSNGPQRQNAPRAEARAKTRATESDNAVATGRVAAAGGARPAPPLATREIRLKIE